MSEEQQEPGLDKWLSQRHGIQKPSVTEEEVVSYRIVILVTPVPVSFVPTKWGIAPSSETTKYQAAVRLWLKSRGRLITDPKLPLTLKVWFYFSPPQSLAKKLILPPMVTKPDNSNLIKSFEDCLKPYRKKVKGVLTLIQEGLIPDDNQIVDLQVKKAYTHKTPRIVMILSHPKPPSQIIQDTLL